MWTTASLSRPPSNKETLRHTNQVGVVPSAEKVDCQLEGLIMPGQTWIGDCWYAPMTIKGTECFALVDTGSSAMLVKPEMVKNKKNIFPTMVKLQTVTGGDISVSGAGEEVCPLPSVSHEPRRFHSGAGYSWGIGLLQ